jgi:hypothetical protein
VTDAQVVYEIPLRRLLLLKTMNRTIKIALRHYHARSMRAA